MKRVSLVVIADLLLATSVSAQDTEEPLGEIPEVEIIGSECPPGWSRLGDPEEVWLVPFSSTGSKVVTLADVRAVAAHPTTGEVSDMLVGLITDRLQSVSRVTCQWAPVNYFGSSAD